MDRLTLDEDDEHVITTAVAQAKASRDGPRVLSLQEVEAMEAKQQQHAQQQQQALPPPAVSNSGANANAAGLVMRPVPHGLLMSSRDVLYVIQQQLRQMAYSGTNGDAFSDDYYYTQARLREQDKQQDKAQVRHSRQRHRERTKKGRQARKGGCVSCLMMVVCVFFVDLNCGFVWLTVMCALCMCCVLCVAAFWWWFCVGGACVEGDPRDGTTGTGHTGPRGTKQSTNQPVNHRQTRYTHTHTRQHSSIHVTEACLSFFPKPFFLLVSCVPPP